MDVPARILVVDDDRTFRLSTAALLRADGHDVAVAADGQEATAMLARESMDLVLLDLRMPGIDGLGLLEALRVRGHGIPILMISGFGTVDAAVRSLHLGADDFLLKPVEPEVLSARVADLLARRPQPRGEPNPAGIIGRSPPMRALIERLRRVAPTETTVLVTGETGCGKELVARAIHQLSPRATAPLLAVNCAAFAEGLLETELFGHVKGAFTGASRDRVGVFEAADGGTLFLDEVAEMSFAVQARLLRAVQEREITRVGSSRATRVDVRLVAATNRDLRALVDAGRFREDLYYRIAVFPLAVPALRERRSDIPLLVESALGRLRQRLPGAERLDCSPLAIRLLRSYEWPGNVRQLFSVLERAAIDAGGSRIQAQHLPLEVREAAGPLVALMRYRTEHPPDDERAAIENALAQTGGALAKAAELLGMSRTTLWRKLRQSTDERSDARDVVRDSPEH
jgi:two-component system response regulator HydG